MDNPSYVEKMGKRSFFGRLYIQRNNDLPKS